MLNQITKIMLIVAEKRLYLYDYDKFSQLEICHGHKDSILDIKFMTENQMIYTAGYDKNIM